MFAALTLSVSGCGGGSSPQESRSQVDVVRQVDAASVISLGDIDPDEPGRRVRRIQPLADFLGRSLADFGISMGEVVVARDIDEMSRLMAEGRVDLLLDSVMPALAVGEMAGAQIILRRWAKGAPEYWSVFITRHDSGIRSVDELAGKRMAFQEPHSTSGYLLPAAHLAGRGLALRRVDSPAETVGPTEVGCFFSRDEENSVEMVRTGVLPAGAISNQDYSELPDEYTEEIVVFAQTDPVPRQVVAARAGLAPAMVAKIRSLLLELSDQDRRELEAQDPGKAWTWRFDEIGADAQATLSLVLEQMNALRSAGEVG